MTEAPAQNKAGCPRDNQGLPRRLALGYAASMVLDQDIESLFRDEPVLAAIPRRHWRVSLLGGLTNRSYRLQADENDLVLRWPGASASRYLDRRAEPVAARTVAGLGLAPHVLAADPTRGWYITAYETGAQTLTAADFAQAGNFRDVVALLTKLHRAAIRFPAQQGLFQAIDLYLTLAPAPRMLALRRRLEPVQSALARNRLSLVPCHIDPNPANFLRCADGRLQLIDWEFAAMEEPLWDLAAVTLEAEPEQRLAASMIEPLIGAAQMPRFELYKTALNLVAASWCEAEIVAGNESGALAALRDQRILRLDQRLADARHAQWLSDA